MAEILKTAALLSKQAEALMRENEDLRKVNINLLHKVGEQQKMIDCLKNTNADSCKQESDDDIDRHIIAMLHETGIEIGQKLCRTREADKNKES